VWIVKGNRACRCFRSPIVRVSQERFFGGRVFVYAHTICLCELTSPLVVTTAFSPPTKPRERFTSSSPSILDIASGRAASPIPIMASGEVVKAKASRKKKKRISKHVLLSKAQAAANAANAADASSTSPGVQPTVTLPGLPSQGADGVVSAPTPQSAGKRRKETGGREKDPSEALAYLQSWREHSETTRRRQEGDKGAAVDSAQSSSASTTATATGPPWKFNKNTQSWIVRHMYDPDKVPKHAFELLLEYLRTMHEGSGKVRMLQDAHRRVVRYKKMEQQQQQQKSSEPASSSAAAAAAVAVNEGGVENGGEVKAPVREEAGDGAKARRPPSNGAEEDDDDARWSHMSDHDRRKEYKRARRVLELFQIGE
jgi:WKF domain